MEKIIDSIKSNLMHGIDLIYSFTQTFLGETKWRIGFFVVVEIWTE